MPSAPTVTSARADNRRTRPSRRVTIAARIPVAIAAIAGRYAFSCQISFPSSAPRVTGSDRASAVSASASTHAGRTSRHARGKPT